MYNLNKFKYVQQILGYSSIKDVSCAIILPQKKNS